MIAHRFICIHFLDIRDGSPHPSLISNVIVWESPPGTTPEVQNQMAMTGSRIMTHFFHEDDLPDTEVWKIVIWNWKTGDLVRFCCPSSRALLTSSY